MLTRPRGPQSGVALITVMAILSILAVIAFSFLTAARLELETSRNFQQAMRVQDVTEGSIQMVNTWLNAQQNGPDGIPYSGDEPRQYDSKLDFWYVGVSRPLERDTSFSVRGHLPGQLRAVAPYFPNGYTDPEYFLPLGLDEDPPGDLSVQMGFDTQSAPGLLGIDDDGDGLTDEDVNGISHGQAGYLAAYDDDDDEDGRIDEDPGYVPPDLTFAQSFVPGDPRTDLALQQTYMVDADEDFAGVVDESSLLNLNFAGNANLRYNEGYSTYEMDLVSMLINLGWTSSQAEAMARSIIEYRHGDDRVPGVVGDDNGNNNPATGFNLIDDDGDGLTDEFDEVFVGFPTSAQYRGLNTIILGDGIDNDGDGLTDEQGEGIDDPGEYSLVADNTFSSVDELGLATGFERTDLAFGNAVRVFDKVRYLVTVYSCSPQIVSGCGEVVIDARKGPYSPELINPSLLLSSNAGANGLGGIAYVSPIQVDNDGDWDPRRDDHNRNGRPDGNWDSGPERDTLEPFYSSNGADDDLDGMVDEPGEGNGIDDDRDGLIDDDGDINGDGNVGYDPEWHVNEDPWGDANGDGFPGLEGEDDDGDGGADYNDPEVRAAMQNSETDGVDNDWDGVTDEPGEPYIPSWDDDEDGRFDEDPPEYPFLLNLMDSIDQPIAGFDPPTITQLYGYSGMQVRDPLQSYATYIGTTVDALPIPVNSAADGGIPKPVEGGPGPSRYLENLNTVGTFSGLENVRISEVLSAPVIHLEAEGADRFDTEKDGEDDDTAVGEVWSDSSFSTDTAHPSGFVPYERKQTERDNRGVFHIRNDPYFQENALLPNVRLRKDLRPEGARWRFSDLPPGRYDLIVYIGQDDRPFSDTNDPRRPLYSQAWRFNGDTLQSLGAEFPTSGDTGTFYVPNVDLSSGSLDVEINIPADVGRNGQNTTGAAGQAVDVSFDAIDLVRKDLCYVEMMNLSRLPVDVSEWQLRVSGAGPQGGAYILPGNTVIPPDDISTPAVGENILLVVRDENALSEFYGDMLGSAPIVTAESATGELLTLSGLSNTLNQARRFVPVDGYVDLEAPVAGSAGRFIVVDRFKYFNYSANPKMHTGRMGTIAQERRDPGELRFDVTRTTSGSRSLNRVDPYTPTMRLYARDAYRDNLGDMTLVGALLNEDPALVSSIGMLRADKDVGTNNTSTFTWPGSAKLAQLDGTTSVFQVRVFGRFGYPVGHVEIPEAPQALELNAQWFPRIDPTVDLYVNPLRITYSQLHHGDVAFFWFPEGVDPEDDLTLKLSFEKIGRNLRDNTADFFFDYVEITRVGDYEPGQYLNYYRTGTPGRQNAFYQPLYFPETGRTFTGLPYPDTGGNPADLLTGELFGLDQDLKTQRFAPVKQGAIASPGYLINIHNGAPFGRFGLFDLRYNFPFLTGSRTEGAMIPGQININTAAREVLSALPFAPPNLSADARAAWNRIVAQHVILGRRLVGHDGVYGPPRDADGDGALDVGDPREYKAFGSDDGPYADVADLVPVLLSPGLAVELEAAFPGQVEVGDLSLMFARVCNLATTRSMVFSVFSQGFVYDLGEDREEPIRAQRAMQAIFVRFAQ